MSSTRTRNALVAKRARVRSLMSAAPIARAWADAETAESDAQASRERANRVAADGYDPEWVDQCACDAERIADEAWAALGR